ncbi:Ger(x)C family spore germination protein [Paenibacillus sp. IB182363]|uniref:Ger(X)C family spore germination protein n=2 Tax=Paenibacillus oceani TaxID=2772510 RepID=A0A927CCH4_9BACL|nr:Ger(x)C family spore germination protein [Paenibacillus oceani]
MAALLLTGCWNSKDIQKMAYVTALGFDYADGKIVSYVQVLNFSNVAKGETSQVGKSVPVWVGKGEGITVTESLTDIYSTSQIRIFWGHIKAIVCTESFMQNGQRIKEAYDMVNRYREIRYNVLLYGTKDNLRDIFIQKSLLNFSPIDTVMSTPSQIYTQRSFILPVYGFKLIAHFNEAGSPIMLPSITVAKGDWTEDQKKKSMLRINGAYFFRKLDMIGWLSENDLAGYRWAQQKLERSPINVPDNANPAVALVLTKPRFKVTTVINGDVKYNIHVKMQAYLDEMTRDITEKEIEDQAAQVVKEEIMATYKKGLRIQADIFKLDEVLYRNHPKLWRERHERGAFLLTPDSINEIVVKISLLHTGKYKGRAD